MFHCSDKSPGTEKNFALTEASNAPALYPKALKLNMARYLKFWTDMFPSMIRPRTNGKTSESNASV